MKLLLLFASSLSLIPTPQSPYQRIGLGMRLLVYPAIPQSCSVCCFFVCHNIITGNSLSLSDLRYTLVVLVMFLLSSVLCPVLWYLWIHAGSANANFFFAMTLTYALAQVITIIQ